MSDPRDPDLDPSDWLASQFEAPESQPATADAPSPAAPPAPAVPPAAAPPAYPPPPAPQPVFPPPAAPPGFPPAAEQNIPFGDPAATAAAAGAGGFPWSLTPGGTPDAAPQVAPVAPAAPPAAPRYVPPPEQLLPPPAAPAPPPLLPPTQAFPQPFDPGATQAMPATFDPGATQAMPLVGQDIEPVPFDPARWGAAPVDPAFDGMTEVIEAEIVGLGAPEGEGVEASALDSLFGETQFKEYADELITAPPPRTTGGGGGAGGGTQPGQARAPMPRNQKILLSVAGGLLAVLALIALFLVGTKLPALLGPAPAVASPSPSPSPSLIVLPLGPVAPGEHQWDELLGGECLKPYESAWQDTFAVVDCAQPHPAQMVFRGLFADSEVAAYPGLEELQKRINLLCTAPTVIDYSKAGAVNDIQVEASYAVDAADWDAGNRTYFCFVTRTSGQDLTQSIAIPQLAPSTPTPAP